MICRSRRLNSEEDLFAIFISGIVFAFFHDRLRNADGGIVFCPSALGELSLAANILAPLHRPSMHFC
jgi:hypothetical protein